MYLSLIVYNQLLLHPAHDYKLIEYAKYLRSLYKAVSSSRDQWPPPPTKKVFRLAMIKSKEKLRKRNTEDDIVRQRTIVGKVDSVLQQKVEVDLSQIFSDIGDCEQKKVLMEGAPGCGKSTLSLHVCQQWTCKKMFGEYKLVILVKLRDLISQNAKTITDMLPKLNDKMGEEISTEITGKNGSGVLFVLDGWDELPKNSPGYSIILKLLDGTQLNECSIIITSRPTSSTALQPLVCSRIEILGFTKNELQQYFSDCLNEDKDRVKTLLERIEVNPVVEGSCYLPLNASILVHVFEYGDNALPDTQYGIFSALICNCILRDVTKRGQKAEIHEISSLDSLPPEINGPFQYLCEVAYNGVMKDQVIFNIEQPIKTLGLLQGVESFVRCGKLHSYNFLHLSIQEVLAAHYIAKKFGEREQKEQFNKLFYNPRFTAVFQFYAAITKLKAQGIDEIVMKVAVKCASQFPTSEDKAHLLSLLHCLFESQDSPLCLFVAKELKSKLDLGSRSLSPADCYSIGYFVSVVQNFDLVLDTCSIGAAGCKALFTMGRAYNLRVLK